MFVIKIYTAQPLKFTTTEQYLSKVFVKTSIKEFKSVLRSPHANKNAQEQFYKIKYVYQIWIESPTSLEACVRRLQQDHSNIIKSFSVFEQKTVRFKN